MPRVSLEKVHRFSDTDIITFLSTIIILLTVGLYIRNALFYACTANQTFHPLTAIVGFQSNLSNCGLSASQLSCERPASWFAPEQQHCLRCHAANHPHDFPSCPILCRKCQHYIIYQVHIIRAVCHVLIANRNTFFMPLSFLHI